MEEGALEPLTAGRGVTLGGQGGLLVLEEEGLPEQGLSFVCLANHFLLSCLVSLVLSVLSLVSLVLSLASLVLSLYSLILSFVYLVLSLLSLLSPLSCLDMGWPGSVRLAVEYEQ